MTISTKHISTHFNHAASTYDQAAFLQNEIGKRLLLRTSSLRNTPTTIVDLGCGTGQNTASIKTQFPNSQVIAVDIAQEMAKCTQTKAQVTALCGDIHSLPLQSQSVDMVISNCVLQWSHDPSLFLRQCHRVLKPNGTLFLSSFGPDTLKELRLSFNHSPHEHVHRFMDMHDIGDVCLQQGFSDPVLDRDDITVTYSSVNSLLSDLKKLGATNQHTKRNPGLMGKKTWQKMLTNYEMFKSDKNLYPASYEIFYCHAVKSDNKHIPTTIQQSNQQKANQ